MVDDGTIGKIYYYDSTRINLGLIQRDVNVVWDLAVHDFAILDHLLGETPVAVSATGADVIGGRRERQENVAHVTLYYDSGATAHVNVNWLAPVKIRQTLIGGSKRMIVWDDIQPDEKIKVYDRGVSVETVDDDDERRRRLVSYRMGDMYAPRLPLQEALSVEFSHILACIDGAAEPLASGAMGLRVVQVLESAGASLAGRGRPVEIQPALKVA
jgi:predicted dehydrogenase